ncbi:MAG: helix-turn-helix domain-containing protein [Firmicutes bacterium]|nr:helix-turn-helix domain-containing protein [Bacillota bacterium]
MRFYTVAEVARLLRVRKSYVYELVAQGRLCALRLSERRIRIPQEALQEFLEQELCLAAAK